jgi:hypothetical protein
MMQLAVILRVCERRFLTGRQAGTVGDGVQGFHGLHYSFKTALIDGVLHRGSICRPHPASGQDGRLWDLGTMTRLLKTTMLVSFLVYPMMLVIQQIKLSMLLLILK